MANRRKFIAGLGALATGSAAAMGTGAFTSVTADRQISATVAGDASAFLSLEKISDSPNSQQYVTENNDKIGFDFSSDNGAINGSETNGEGGFNLDATTKIDRLLRVTNQGTQEVSFTLNLGGDAEKGSNNATFSTDEQGGESDLVTNSIDIPAGEHIIIDLEFTGPPEKTGTWSGTITFYAEATE